MNDRLRHYLEIVRTSLWLIPVLMGCAAFGLAIVLLSWGRGIINDASDYWLLYAGDTENARELLSALLTGMISMTALVVSITMVVLTLAAGQIGPRLIRTFIQDRVTQFVLGLFLSHGNDSFHEFTHGRIALREAAFGPGPNPAPQPVRRRAGALGRG